MKNKIIAFASIILISGLFYANSIVASCTYTTYCGYTVTTVCPEYFQDYDELFDYLSDLDYIYCGW